MRVVAAAGNDGTTRPVFPAALTGVVAVTAVDVRRRHWPRANSGEYVAIAAPGVDVWTIDGIGRGYYATGTSFAAIFVSAALALGAPAQPALGTWLKLHAEDLGPPGRDRLFGFGLLRAGGLCP
jgi:subtilisin family serine protease